MTKNEFMSRLEDALEQKNVNDIAEILSEYEQHFTFKMADGYTEEEIAEKLGDPLHLAEQFSLATQRPSPGGKKIPAAIGLFFSNLGAGLFFLLLFAWETLVSAFSLGSAAMGFCLVCRLNPWQLLPPMPYGCALVYGFVFMTLAVLSATGCVYFASFLRQLMRAFRRFHKNVWAAASGQPTLPPLAAAPAFGAKAKRCLRRTALVALCIFAILFLIGMAVSMLSAGSLEFWHTWGWFGHQM